MHLFIVAALVLLINVTLCFAGEARTWSDASGKHTVSAELIGVDGSTVTLKKADGNEIRLQLEKLSKTDQDFIAHQQFGIGKDASNDAVAGDEAKTEDAPDPSTVGSNHLNTFKISTRSSDRSGRLAKLSA